MAPGLRRKKLTIGHPFYGYPNARDRYNDDSAYERTVEFCAKYDEISFDPDYPNAPLSTFEPMVRKLLAKPWVPPQ